jgi:cell division protein ZapE
MLKHIFSSVTSLTNQKRPDVSGLLNQHYQQKVSQTQLRHDDAQVAALCHLQDLLERLIIVTSYEQKPLAQKLLSTKPEKCRSLYLYGGVGRGKSMLMELFYDACPIEKKKARPFQYFYA